MNQIQSRRDFLAGLAGLGASIVFPSSKSFGQSSAPAAGRIDVHHHFAKRSFIRTGPRRAAAEGISFLVSMRPPLNTTRM